MTTDTHLHAVQIHHPTPPEYIAAESIDHALELLAAAPAGSARPIIMCSTSGFSGFDTFPGTFGKSPSGVLWGA